MSDEWRIKNRELIECQHALCRIIPYLKLQGKTGFIQQAISSVESAEVALRSELIERMPSSQQPFMELPENRRPM